MRKLGQSDLVPADPAMITVGDWHILRDVYHPEPDWDGKQKPAVVKAKRCKVLAVDVATPTEVVGFDRTIRREPVALVVVPDSYVSHMPVSYARDGVGRWVKIEHRAISPGEQRWVPIDKIGRPWESIVPFLDHERQIPKRRERGLERIAREGLMEYGDLGGASVGSEVLEVLLDEVEICRAEKAELQDLLAAAHEKNKENAA